MVCRSSSPQRDGKARFFGAQWGHWRVILHAPSPWSDTIRSCLYCLDLGRKSQSLSCLLKRSLKNLSHRKLEGPLKVFQIIRHCGVTAPLCSAVRFITIGISCVENCSIRPLFEICLGIFVKPHSLSKRTYWYANSEFTGAYNNLCPVLFIPHLLHSSSKMCFWHFDIISFDVSHWSSSSGFFCSPSQAQQADGRSLHSTWCCNF